jgi:hypothetical protein
MRNESAAAYAGHADNIVLRDLPIHASDQECFKVYNGQRSILIYKSLKLPVQKEIDTVYVGSYHLSNELKGLLSDQCDGHTEDATASHTCVQPHEL